MAIQSSSQLLSRFPSPRLLRSSSNAIPAKTTRKSRLGGCRLAGWNDNPDRFQQKDLDTRWANQNDISYYAYQNSICIDVGHGLIHRYTTTPANTLDSQMLPRLLDPDNEYNYAWADSAYSGECFESLLSFRAFKSLIQAKGARNHPLCDAAKELDRSKSAIRAYVEPIFDSMTMSINGKLKRKIGPGRAKAWQGLEHLTLKLLPHLTCFQRCHHCTKSTEKPSLCAVLGRIDISSLAAFSYLWMLRRTLISRGAHQAITSAPGCESPTAPVPA